MSELVKKLEAALNHARTLENQCTADKAHFFTMADNLRTMRTELNELQATLDRERASHDIVWADRCEARREVDELTSEVKCLSARNTKLDTKAERDELKAKVAELEASNEVLTQSCQANAYTKDYVETLEAAVGAYVPTWSYTGRAVELAYKRMQETRKNLNHKG